MLAAGGERPRGDTTEHCDEFAALILVPASAAAANNLNIVELCASGNQMGRQTPSL
jgi:hypothetical protein